MEYCESCGARFPDGTEQCPYCGEKLTRRHADSHAVPRSSRPAPRPAPTPAPSREPAPRTTAGSGFIWGVLGFCLPLAGLIIYLLLKRTRPEISHAAGKGAMINVIVTVIFYVLMLVIGVLGASVM